MIAGRSPFNATEARELALDHLLTAMERLRADDHHGSLEAVADAALQIARLVEPRPATIIRLADAASRRRITDNLP